MPLKLTITSYQRLSPDQETTKILDRGSINFGRAPQNDWVLQDPERILSKLHGTVQYRDGAYFLTDRSQNGIFLNDSEQRIPKDQTVRLNDGDRFVLGEYEIAVTLQPEATDLIEAALEEPLTDIVPPGADLFGVEPSPAAEPRQGISADVSLDIAKPPFDDILSEDRDGGLQHPIEVVPGAAVTAPPPDLSSPERISFELPSLAPGTPAAAAHPSTEQPPPVVLAKAAQELPFQPSSATAESPVVESPALPESTEQPPVVPAAPSSESLIPEDWWIQPAGPPIAATPATPPPPILATPVPPIQAPAKTPAPPLPPQKPHETPGLAPRPTPTNAPPAAAPGPDVSALLQAFFTGAGLPQLKLPPEQLPEIMSNLGGILRETVQGLMEVLLARSDVKGEFRLDRTAIGPVENNPLKTPPGRPPLSPAEVMALLLIGQKDAYMSPVQAVCESFNDIKAHQLAVVAGIQAALNRLLERFDPANLETRLQQSVLDNLWPANRKAKYWDLFTAEYQAIAQEAEDDFKALFGDEFARAYENRLRAP